MAKLIEIMESRKVYWLVEQPEGSRFFKFPDVKAVLERTPHYVIKTWMGHFGGQMPKPTMLVGNVPTDMAHALAKEKPPNLKMGWGAEKKGRWVSGTKNLGDSAMYPENFVNAYADAFQNATSLPTSLCPESVWEPLTGCPLAPVARCGGVADFMERKAASKGCQKITEFFVKAKPVKASWKDNCIKVFLPGPLTDKPAEPLTDNPTEPVETMVDEAVKVILAGPLTDKPAEPLTENLTDTEPLEGICEGQPNTCLNKAFLDGLPKTRLNKDNPGTNDEASDMHVETGSLFCCDSSDEDDDILASHFQHAMADPLPLSRSPVVWQNGGA